MTDKDTILIEIASFREMDLLNTVNSALIQADHPERVYFGICYQDNNKDDYNKLLKIPNCKVKYYTETETKGLCFARNVCQHLIEDEKYILQIDAHMRFVKHWDTKMIEQLIGTNDENGIISFYPPNCTEEMMSLPLDDKKYDIPGPASVIYPAKFNKYPSYFITFNSYPLDKEDGLYLRNPFISGGNFFTYSKVHKEVYNDPDMFFYADEMAISLRLYTYGYNIYVPNKSYIYHQYQKKIRHFPKITTQMDDEDNRFTCLIGINKDIDLGEYGLGKKRTLSQFESFSGIDFENRTITSEAKQGIYNTFEYSKTKNVKKKINIDIIHLKEREEIEVIIVDLFNEYIDCIKSCLTKSSKPNRIHFIVGTTGEISKDLPLEKYHIKHIEKFYSGTSYSKTLSKIAKKTGKGCVAIIDSHCRFIKNWDSYYSIQLLECGESSVLTSWVWAVDEPSKLETFTPYNNVVYEFKGFNGNQPQLVYNESINLATIENLYHTAFIKHGFLFGLAETFKAIPFDPNLNYEEQKAIYSVRLWTNGIDLYLPKSSYVLRKCPDSDLNSNELNNIVLSGIFNINDYYGRLYPDNYQYGLGKKRALWSFYEFIKYDK